MTPRTVSGTAAGSIDAGRRRLYARLAGSLFLLYIAASLAESSMFGYAVRRPRGLRASRSTPRSSA